MPFNNFEIDESDKKYSIDKLKPSSEEMFKIFSKAITIFQERAKFWKKNIEIGKLCTRYKRRDVFTSSQRKKYSDSEKIPIETQEMKTALHALTDLILKGVKSVTIKMEDESPQKSTPSPEVMNVVLSDFERILKRDRFEYSLLSDALTTCFPNWLWFDDAFEVDGIHKKITLEHPQWDSMLPDQYFENKDGSDIKSVTRHRYVTKAQLMETYPDRVEAFERFEEAEGYDPGLLSQVSHEDNGNTSSSRSDMIYNVIQSSSYNKVQGFYLLIERFFQVKKSREIWIQDDPFCAVEMPSHFTEEEKNEWLNDPNHQGYQLKVIDDVKTLWVTSVTDNGFVWENSEHWYQNEGKLPGLCYIPAIVDQIPTGPGEDMLPRVLNACASETEGLHQVLTGTSRTLFTVDGAYSDPHMVKKVLNVANGSIRIKKETARKMGGIKGCYSMEDRTPNTVFFEHADRNRAKLREENGINDAMQGITNPRQSDKAKQTDITQGMTTQSPYVRNFNYFKIDFKNLLISLVPYQYTTQEVIRIDDEYGMEPVEVTVNQLEINIYTGEAQKIANDLTKGKFVAIPSVADDSPTNKDREREQYVELLAAVGNSIHQFPRAFARIFYSFENRFCKQMGIDLMQEAEAMEQQKAQEAQMEAQKELQIEKGRRDVDRLKLEKTKKALNVKMGPEDLQKAPVASQALLEVFNK